MVQVNSAIGGDIECKLAPSGRGSSLGGTWLDRRLAQVTLGVAEELAGFANTCLQLFWFPLDVSQQLQVHLIFPPPTAVLAMSM